MAVMHRLPGGKWMVVEPLRFKAGGRWFTIDPGFVAWATIGGTRRWNARAVAVHDWLHIHQPDGVTASEAARVGLDILREDGAPRWYRLAWRAFWHSGLFWAGWKLGIR